MEVGDIKDRSIELVQRTIAAGKNLAEQAIGGAIGTIDTVGTHVADVLPDEVTERVAQAGERIGNMPLVRGIVSYVPGLNTERSEPQPTMITGTRITAKKTTSRSLRSSGTKSSASRPEGW